MVRDLPARATTPVLVVSSDEAAREAYIAQIRSANCSAVGAATCEEALRVTGRIRFRAVVFDVVNTSDWFQCRRLCESLEGTPVVVLSATCTPDRWYRGMAQRLGCAGFVLKPCAPALVVDVLHRTCAGEPWVEHMG